jgi:hypothetical protein
VPEPDGAEDKPLIVPEPDGAEDNPLIVPEPDGAEDNPLIVPEPDGAEDEPFIRLALGAVEDEPPVRLPVVPELELLEVEPMPLEDGEVFQEEVLVVNPVPALEREPPLVLAGSGPTLPLVGGGGGKELLPRPMFPIGNDGVMSLSKPG